MSFHSTIFLCVYLRVCQGGIICLLFGECFHVVWFVCLFCLFELGLTSHQHRKVIQRRGPRFKVSSDWLVERGNRTSDPWVSSAVRYPLHHGIMWFEECRTSDFSSPGDFLGTHVPENDKLQYLSTDQLDVILTLKPWTSTPNCIKEFWWLPKLNRHLTGIVWPTRFDVSIVIWLARTSRLEVGYPINFFKQFSTGRQVSTAHFEVFCLSDRESNPGLPHGYSTYKAIRAVWELTYCLNAFIW